MIWSLFYTALPIAALFATFAGAAAWPRARSRTISSPDGLLRAVIVPVGVRHGFERMESRVEIHERDGETLCSRDFSSRNGRDGLGVVRAQWSADSSFFIFSMAPSGKSVSDHWPSFAYGRYSNNVRELEHDGSIIVTPKFALIPPHSVRTVTCPHSPRTRKRRFEIIVDLEQLFRRPWPVSAD
ncbi:MAG: hypothetical protein ACREQE_11115 [Candidatus Binataceae bacterium]